MTFFQPTIAAFKGIFTKPKSGSAAYGGTHTGPEVYTTSPTFRTIRPAKLVTKGILKLPPEILLDIFELALKSNEGISRLCRPASIGRTCRRFHEVLLPYIYSDCRMVFQYPAYGDSSAGCMYSRDKLELFRHYGAFVRKMSIMADCTVLPSEVQRIRRFPWAPAITSALFDLTPSFTLLTSVDFDGKFDNSIPDLVHSLQYLLTNSPHLIKLSISIYARWNVDQMELYDHLSKAIKLKQSDESISYANLESLSFSFSEDSPFIAHSMGQLERLPALELLCLILRPATKKTKFFHFNVAIPGLDVIWDQHREQIEKERGQFFHLPELVTLSIRAAPWHICSFYRFANVDYERIKELKVLVDWKQFDRAKFPLFVRRFSTLRTLDLNNIQEFLTHPTSLRSPWWNTQPWQYLRDSLILPRASSLKVLKIGITGDVKEVVENELGWEVLRSCKVEVRFRYTKSVREETCEPYQIVTEGKFDTYGVKLVF